MTMTTTGIMTAEDKDAATATTAVIATIAAATAATTIGLTGSVPDKETDSVTAETVYKL